MRTLEFTAWLALASSAVACNARARAESADDSEDGTQAPVADRCEVRDKLAAEHLATFDDLDFNVFSNQKWERLDESHARDVRVHWPDGRETTGLDRHIEDLNALFVYAPDTRIKEHPVRIANDEWTAVMGTMEGTFTKPMTTPDGETIEPTGRRFKLPMVTLAHWTEDGVMDEEYLFWDNQAFLDQIGVGKN
jgi:hypothetical protein